MISLAAEFPNDNPCLHRGATWVCASTTGPATAVLPVAREPVRFAPAALHFTPAPEPEREPEREPEVEASPPVPAPRESVVVRLAESDVRDEAEPLGLDALAAALEADTQELEGEDEVVVEELEPVAEVIVEGIAIAAAAPSPPPPPAAADPFRVLVSTLVDAALAEGAPAAAAWVVPLLDGTVPADLSAEARALLEGGRVLEGDALTPSFEATRSAWRDILRGTSDDFGACASMLDEWAADVLARLMGSLAHAPQLRRDLRARGVAAFGLAFAA